MPRVERTILMAAPLHHTISGTIGCPYPIHIPVFVSFVSWPQPINETILMALSKEQVTSELLATLVQRELRTQGMGHVSWNLEEHSLLSRGVTLGRFGVRPGILRGV